VRLRWLAALALLAATIAVAVIAALAIVRPLTFWTPDGRDLADSLHRAGDQDFAAQPCERAGRRRWRCEIEDDPGSGPPDAYALTVADGCWRGARSWVPGSRPLRGCFEVLDFVWPP
jgi:hypothetical protein